MTKQLAKASFLWGVILWFIGYVLGIIFFMIVPPAMIGWAVMPIGIVIAILILYKKVHLQTFHEYVILAVVWTAIAVVFDFLFLVKLMKPADGYYKPDVYLYYLITFVLPLIVARQKKTAVS